MNNSEYIEEEITFAELAARLGILDLDTPNVYDMIDEDYEIESFDHATGTIVWKPLEAFVVKDGADEHYQINTLHGTANHRVFFEGQYVELKDHPAAELVKSPIQVVDCQVADTHNYIAEGQINHNTTTPGGNAVPYASSVRLKMTGGSFIKKKIDGEERVIGIEVNVETIKNKIAPPRRKVSFNIYFGRGIEEDEQIFDAVRVWCDNQPDSCFVDAEGNKITLEGTGAWKYFKVTKKGENDPYINQKFYKVNFGEEVVRGPHKALFGRLFEAAYTHSPENNDIASEDDPEDYETARARTLENTSVADLTELD